MAEWLKAADCKSALSGYAGSNPASSTIIGYLENFVMSFLKIYGHLPGYLHRWKLFGAGRFMARVHRILDIDRTPFLHNHPFAYLSVVLRGGYDERVMMSDGSLRVVSRKAGSIVFRSANDFHRIDKIHGCCVTLFLTWSVKSDGQGWCLKRHRDVEAPDGYVNYPDGMYFDCDEYRKRVDGMWYSKRKTHTDAEICDRLSIHQNIIGCSLINSI